MSLKEEGVFQVRVRYSETDQMGYVYYGNYARYYEIGRTELMRSMGVHYRSMEEKGIIMPVISLEVKYLRPATYDDLIEIRTMIKKLTDKIIVFESLIYNEKNELLNRGIVSLCFLDKTSHQRISTPSFISEQIK